MNHGAQRLIERIVSQNTLDVIKEGSTACYSKVGEYKLTQLVKDQIVSKVESIKTTDFGNRDYGILIHNFGKVVRTPDTMSESNGDSLYAIVRNNEIFTICSGFYRCIKDISYTSFFFRACTRKQRILMY